MQAMPVRLAAAVEPSLANALIAGEDEEAAQSGRRRVGQPSGVPGGPSAGPGARSGGRGHPQQPQGVPPGGRGRGGANRSKLWVLDGRVYNYRSLSYPSCGRPGALFRQMSAFPMQLQSLPSLNFAFVYGVFLQRMQTSFRNFDQNCPHGKQDLNVKDTLAPGSVPADAGRVAAGTVRPPPARLYLETTAKKHGVGFEACEGGASQQQAPYVCSCLRTVQASSFDLNPVTFCPRCLPATAGLCFPLRPMQVCSGAQLWRKVRSFTDPIMSKDDLGHSRR